MKQSSRIIIGLVIAELVILTFQGWSGDFVNLFAVFPGVKVITSFGAIAQAIKATGAMEVTHIVTGILLLAIAIALIITVFRAGTVRWVRIWAVLGFLAICSAAYGGISFVLSEFQNNGNSAQMGGSFISAYASYFLALYFIR